MGYFVPPAPGHEVDPVMAEYSKAAGLSGNTTNIWRASKNQLIVNFIYY
jgi:hypothetical protein